MTNGWRISLALLLWSLGFSVFEQFRYQAGKSLALWIGSISVATIFALVYCRATGKHPAVLKALLLVLCFSLLYYSLAVDRAASAAVILVPVALSIISYQNALQEIMSEKTDVDTNRR